MTSVAWEDAWKVQPAGETHPERQSCRLFLQESRLQLLLLGQLCPLDPDSFYLCIKLERHGKSHGPSRFEWTWLGMCIYRWHIIMFVAHCSPDYCNRRQRCLLRASSRLLTGCYLVPAVPSWCLVERSHPSPGTAFSNSNEFPVGKLME